MAGSTGVPREPNTPELRNVYLKFIILRPLYKVYSLFKGSLGSLGRVQLFLLVRTERDQSLGWGPLGFRALGGLGDQSLGFKIWGVGFRV